jgi:hypothetical protein
MDGNRMLKLVFKYQPQGLGHGKNLEKDGKNNDIGF